MTRTVAAFLMLCSVAATAFGQHNHGFTFDDPTHVATASGSWQEPKTWQGNKVPADGAKVLIQRGAHVTNHGETADCLWIAVNGELDFCDHCETKINVHTIAVPANGSFRMGTPTAPITGQATVEFIDGPLLDGDWQKMSRGLLVFKGGEFTCHGVEKTAWDEVADVELPIGATEVNAANAPYGWQVGDRVLIAGTDSTWVAGTGEEVKYQSEYRQIAAIDGERVTLDAPLSYRHFRWRPDLPFWVANLTRNVAFQSRSTASIWDRGHAMFMPGSHTDLRYTSFTGMGRTDKDRDVTDPRKTYDSDVLVPGSDENPRARYACHWHRVGPYSPPVTVKGVVIDGSPGWGFVNHKSNVQVDDGICINCFGSAFTTEEGQERGYFRHCLAALNRGKGDDPTLSGDANHGNRFLGDWGKDGSGFWLQGGLVEVSDCVSFDNSGRGYAVMNVPLNEWPDYPKGGDGVADWIKYPIGHELHVLPAAYKRYGDDLIGSGYVPLRKFQRNTAANNHSGCFQMWNIVGNHATDEWPEGIYSQIDDLTTWGRGMTVSLHYARRVRINGLDVTGDLVFRPETSSITKGKVGLNVRFEDVVVKKFCTAGLTPGKEWGDSGKTDAERDSHIIDVNGCKCTCEEGP